MEDKTVIDTVLEVQDGEIDISLLFGKIEKEFKLPTEDIKDGKAS